jgi:hypothetical protein
VRAAAPCYCGRSPFRRSAVPANHPEEFASGPVAGRPRFGRSVWSREQRSTFALAVNHAPAADADFRRFRQTAVSPKSHPEIPPEEFASGPVAGRPRSGRSVCSREQRSTFALAVNHALAADADFRRFRQTAVSPKSHPKSIPEIQRHSSGPSRQNKFSRKFHEQRPL